MDTLVALTDPVRAELIMHPLRRRILAGAVKAPISATEVAAVLGETRQKVNYHVRALVEAGLLEAAGERQRRGLVEKLYRASARRYSLTPEVLGELAPLAGEFTDAFAAATLVALAGRVQAEVGRSARQAKSSGKRLATVSVDTEVSFTSAAEQAAFAEALTQAVADVTSRFAKPAAAGDHRYRVVLGAYPIPMEEGDS